MRVLCDRCRHKLDDLFEPPWTSPTLSRDPATGRFRPATWRYECRDCGKVHDVRPEHLGRAYLDTVGAGKRAITLPLQPRRSDPIAAS